MSSDIIGSMNAAIQKINSAKTAIQQKVANGGGSNTTNKTRDFGLQVGEQGIFEKKSYDRDFTRGISDSGTLLDRQTKFSSSSTYRPIVGKNIFDPNNRKITGSNISVTENGKEIFKDEWSHESKEKEKSWLKKHSSANLKGFGDGVSREKSVFGATFENENNKLQVDAIGGEIGGGYSGGFKNGAFNAQAHVNAEAYLLKAEYEGRYGPAYGNAEVFVGAEGTAKLEANFDPRSGDINAGGKVEGFAGGKAEASAGLEGDNGKLGGNAGVTYGIGGELGGDIGMKDGKVKAKVDIGATVGLGFDVGFEAEVDVKETGKDLTGWIPGTPW
ncbi:hypothetical protein [Aquimarina agarilytica]|uniref:hypothetical protein n=1 Tax=Aquimarina agarilytica TaxID=1087449 RepID=UPI000287F942|nr:hypothetical protein [Aquimarina agarilytica]